MASSSASLALSISESSLCQNWEHDVFPSFHGPDVRKSFLSHILKEFRSKAINLFIDNEINRGEFIGPALERAIRGSKIAIVLLSKNYASSSWCLDELVEIMKKVSGQTVITIFYEVDPTDVKKQTGDFGEVFKKSCKGKGEEKIEIWRKALEEVATIAGYHSCKWDNDAIMIEQIAADISKMLNHLTPSHDFDHLIGMRDHIERMEPFLRLDLDEVRMIGIWGPPGIGKTTIARFLFNQFSREFQHSAIMVNIKGNYPKPCLDEYGAQLQLERQLWSLMTNDKDINISHLGVAQGRLRGSKVLLVLDDVDRLAQLYALAKDVNCFGPKSRIIITTEDLRLLKAHGINHIYKVNFPSNDEALQMFCMSAFDQKSPKDGFADLAHQITNIVGELPLGLKVMGSHFRGLSKDEWLMEIPGLMSNLNGDIESILKFSYDALSDEEKYLFLHIACFFNGEFKWKVEEYLAESFENVRQKLNVLAQKSLIFFDNEYIEMHNLLAQLGKDIVRRQSICEPGQRQFLFDDKETCDVLNDDPLVTRRVVGINCSSASNMNGKAFAGMPNLRFLVASFWGHPYIISSPLTYISPKIRLIFLQSFPMKSLPLTNSLEFLVELRIPDSKLEKLWKGTKLLRNLKRIDLERSRNLRLLPNLSTATNLESLNLGTCSSLVELPSSIGNATNLESLNLSECSSLVELPSSIGNATNLESLNLSNCSSLVELPSSIGNATNIKEIKLDGCSSLVELPSSIGNFHRIRSLSLRGCSKLKTLPININMESLDSLDLTDCSLLKHVPEISAVPLRKLIAGNCESLEKVDCSFSRPSISLYFGNCFKLNQEARDHIIQSSIRIYGEYWYVREFTIDQTFSALPGKEVPECFNYRAYGSSVTVKLNQKPLRRATIFKACILFNRKGRDESYYNHPLRPPLVYCCITSKKNGLTTTGISDDCALKPILTEHLYIVSISAKEVTSTELVFEFKLRYCSWEIKECGILQILHHDFEESNDKYIDDEDSDDEDYTDDEEYIDDEESEDEILENHVDEEDKSFRGGDKAMCERSLKRRRVE